MKRGWLAAFLILAAHLSARADAPLADAVEKLERARIEALMERRAEVNAAQADGMTALHWAAHRDEIEIARRLIKSGANVQAENRYGITPLSLACVNGSSAMVEELLEAGADPNAAVRGGETVLMTAARTGKTGPVKALIARGAKVNATEKSGQTAIMWAAAEGHAAVVELLMQAGADFKTPLDGGFTPFFFAIREGRAEVVRLLLEAGVDVNEAMEPKRRAARGPQPGMTPLLMAVENGHLEMALELVKAGADPNDQRAGYTALHNIVWVRKPNRGEDEDGAPPPAGSGSVTSLEFVRRLAAMGADVNARIKRGNAGRGVLTRRGATPFLLACQTADAPLLKLLVELGADPTLANGDGSTPVIAAAGLGCLAAGEVAGTEDEVLEALEFLVKIGADLNAVDKNGETAMHGAAYKNLPKVVQFLYDHGAKIEVWNQKNKWGWTPLLIAEGYRPGNFKPSFETIDAIHKVMLAAGVTPPPRTIVKDINNDDYVVKPKPRAASVTQ